MTSAVPVDLRWSMERYTGHGCLAILVTLGICVSRLTHSVSCSGNQDPWKDDNSHVVQQRKNQATP
jgi:hypothetical protein